MAITLYNKGMRPVFLVFFGIVLGLLAAGCAGQVPSRVPLSHPDMAENLAAKTVALVGLQDDGTVRAYCSGVWVSPTVVMTANHCVSDLEVGDAVLYLVLDDAYSGAIGKLDIVPRDAFLLARDSDHDLALLRAPKPPSHAIAQASSFGVVQGAPVHCMGQPLGVLWSYSSGDISGIRQMPNALGFEMLLIQATVPISPGSSGGGLYDDFGYLIGITHASYTRGQNMNLFIHADYVVAMLDAARKAGTL